MSKRKRIDPKKIRPGPIRNKSLPPKMLDQIKAIYDVIGPYFGKTLEQFEINFMRDSDPESEVIIWVSITAAWIAYHEKFLNDEDLPDEEEKKLLSALIVISTGNTDVKTFGVPVEVGSRLLQCYDDLAKE